MADKLVYMYCNEKNLNCIQSEGYEEDMPLWMYDGDEIKDALTDEYGNVIPSGIKDAATELEVMDNLEIEIGDSLRLK